MKNLNKIIGFIFTGLFIDLNVGHADIITCPSQADAEISQLNGGTNYGGKSSMEIDSESGYQHRMLVKFDLSSVPEGYIVNSAKMRLYLYTYQGDKASPCTVKVYRITEDWKEDEVTWNNAPSRASEPTDKKYVTKDLDDSWVEWDVSSDVQKFVKGEENNYGWIAIITWSSWKSSYSFRTKEYSSQHPELVVDYTEPSSWVTVTPTDISPSEVEAGEINVPMEKLSIATESGTATWTHLKLSRIGTGNDTEISAVKVFIDDNPANDNFDNTDTEIGKGSFANNTVTIDITDQSLTTTAKTYFIVFDISSSACAGNTLGMKAEKSGYVIVASPAGVRPNNFPFESQVTVKGEGVSVIADAEISERNGDTNYGGKSSMEIDSEPKYQHRMLVKFNLSSVDSHVCYAKMKLYLYTYDGKKASPCTVKVYRITEDWEEGTVTWNNAPSRASEPTDKKYVTKDLDDSWVEWDVSSDVQKFVKGEENNYGWIAIITWSNWKSSYSFRTKEHTSSSQHPQLEIAYPNDLIVTTTANSGTNSLYYQMQRANNTPGPDVIKFEIPFGDANFNATESTWVITPNPTLPTLIDDQTYIDGSTQRVYVDKECNSDGPEIIINGTNAGGGASGFILQANGCTIKELTINNFGQNGVYIQNGNNNNIVGCYIGTNYNGTADEGCGLHGIFISGNSKNNIINNNVIAFNGDRGVFITGSDAEGNTISQNSIFNNDDIGIDIADGANENVSPPKISTITPLNKGNYEVSGTAGAGQTIEIFIADANSEEGKTYLGTSIADGSGTWVDTVSVTNSGEMVATATTTNGSTSEFSSATPFAIELLSFSAVEKNGHIVLLWQTEVELDVKGFALERAITNDYTRIATIESKGNIGNIYEYVDSNITVGEEYYYRLGKIDIYNNITWWSVIKVKSGELKEYKFYLAQSIPTPFRHSAIITYSVPGKREKKDVSLKIYDAGGRLIKTLVNEQKVPGCYNVKWYGKDNRNKYVRNGIYFYRLKIGSLTTVKKIIFFGNN